MDDIKTGIVKLSKQEQVGVWQRISAYECDDYDTYKTDCSENREYFYGAQWTEDESDALEDRGQYNLVINKIRKAVNGIVGILTASQPKYKVVPVGREDNDMSQLGSKLIDWVWHNSGGLQTFRKGVKFAARDNIGYYHIYRSKDKNVRFSVLGYDDVVIDPKSKEPLFQDADYVYIIKWMPVSKVKALFGVEIISWDAPSGYYTLDTDGTTTIDVNKIYSYDKQHVKVYEGYSKRFIRQEDGSIKVRILKETVLGVEHVYREWLPDEITEYPIIPVFSEDTENPYKKGEVHFLKGLQKFINKSYGTALLNAQLMSNPKLIVRENDIPDLDLDKFQDDYAKPGSVNVLTQNAPEPIVIHGEPLNNAYFTLYRDAERQFEFSTLPNDLLGYMDSNTKYPQSMLLDIREAVLDSLKYFAGNIETSLSMMGVVAIQYCKAYLKHEEILRIVDAERNVERFAVNVQRGLDVNDPQSVRQYVQQARNNGMGDEEIRQEVEKAQEDGNVVNGLTFLMNDIEALNVDIFVVPGSYAPSFEMANLRLALELMNSGVVDNEAVLEHVPMENRDQIKERLSTIRNQADALANMEDLIEDQQSEISRLTKKLADLGVQDIVREEEFRRRAITKDAMMKARLASNLQKQGVKQVINETKLAAKEYLTDLKNRDEEKSELPLGAEDNVLEAILSEII